MELNLSTYGYVISTDETSSKLLQDILKFLEKTDIIIIDAENVTISTKSARLVFGKLYKSLSSQKFNEKIKFVNASTAFKFSISEGITTELK